MLGWRKNELDPAAVLDGVAPSPQTTTTSTTTLAAIESLAIPLVQEVVFLADFQCERCQQKVAKIMSKMNADIQSVAINVLEKKVTLVCTYSTAAKHIPKSAQQSSWTRFFRYSSTSS